MTGTSAVPHIQLITPAHVGLLLSSIILPATTVFYIIFLICDISLSPSFTHQMHRKLRSQTIVSSALQGSRKHRRQSFLIMSVSSFDNAFHPSVCSFILYCPFLPRDATKSVCFTSSVVIIIHLLYMLLTYLVAFHCYSLTHSSAPNVPMAYLLLSTHCHLQ
jgi:hypothetical protein